jgi:DNA-binding transcriptional MerR regulator
MSWYDKGNGIDFSNPKRRGRFPRIALDTNLLFELYIKDVKVKDIAKKLNVSRPTVKRHLKFIIPEDKKRNNGRAYNPNDSLNREIITYYTNHHYSTTHIGKLVGCSAEKVRRRLINCGIEMRSKTYRNLLTIHPKSLNRKKEKNCPFEDVEEFNNNFKFLYCLNFSKEDIAEIMKVHKNTAKRRIQFLRENNVFKLRVCKHCGKFFRFITTKKHKNSNVCPICMSHNWNIGVSRDFIDFVQKSKIYKKEVTSI